MGETIEDVVRGMVAKQAHLDPSVITPESVLSELGVTSLDLVEIILTMSLQKYAISGRAPDFGLLWHETKRRATDRRPRAIHPSVEQLPVQFPPR